MRPLLLQIEIVTVTADEDKPSIYAMKMKTYLGPIGKEIEPLWSSALCKAIASQSNSRRFIAARNILKAVNT
jgi:hypothetical protein